MHVGIHLSLIIYWIDSSRSDQLLSETVIETPRHFKSRMNVNNNNNYNP